MNTTPDFDQWVAARGLSLLRLAYVLTGVPTRPRRSSSTPCLVRCLAGRGSHGATTPTPTCVGWSCAPTSRGGAGSPQGRPPSLSPSTRPSPDRHHARGSRPPLARLSVAALAAAHRYRAPLLPGSLRRRDRRDDRRAPSQRPLPCLTRPLRAPGRGGRSMTDFETKLRDSLPRAVRGSARAADLAERAGDGCADVVRRWRSRPECVAVTSWSVAPVRLPRSWPTSTEVAARPRPPTRRADRR